MVVGMVDLVVEEKSKERKIVGEEVEDDENDEDQKEKRIKEELGMGMGLVMGPHHHLLETGLNCLLRYATAGAREWAICPSFTILEIFL